MLIKYLIALFTLTTLISWSKNATSHKLHFIFYEKYYKEKVTLKINAQKVFSGKINNGMHLVAKTINRKTRSNKCTIQIDVKNKDSATFEINLDDYKNKHIYITVTLVNSEGLLYVVDKEEPVFY
jgi:hypothetical protein